MALPEKLKQVVLLYYYLVKYRGWQGPCVRNNSTTHMLDRIAAGLGQQCYEVPVGFKYISAKMSETDAVIGGESSGGLAIRGHIFGKDGIYSATLLAEMLAVTGKSLSEMYSEISREYGELFYADEDYSLSPAGKDALAARLFGERIVPAFDEEIEKISYEDGCKVYFKSGSWVICRFSGTEPLLRIAAEGATPESAQKHIAAWQELLEL